MKIAFAIQNGQVVSINDVEKGLACNCYCPDCHDHLIAKKGKIKKHHFSHFSNHNCEYGLESIVHLAAKDILSKSETIVIPQYRDRIPGWGKKVLSEKKKISIDSIIVEKKLDEFVPDILIKSKDRFLIIEIAVTHFVENEKLKKIEQSGIAAIEIDLSFFKKDGLELDRLRRLLIEEVNQKKWLFNPKKEMLISRAEKILEETIREKESKKQKEYKQELNRKEFYEEYSLQIIKRKPKKPTLRKKIWHVEPCPLKKRMYDNFGYTNYYANIFLDCKNCEYFRGINEVKTKIFCLEPYYRNKVS